MNRMSSITLALFSILLLILVIQCQATIRGPAGCQKTNQMRAKKKLAPFHCNEDNQEMYDVLQCHRFYVKGKATRLCYCVNPETGKRDHKNYTCTNPSHVQIKCGSQSANCQGYCGTIPCDSTNDRDLQYLFGNNGYKRRVEHCSCHSKLKDAKCKEMNIEQKMTTRKISIKLQNGKSMYKRRQMMKKTAHVIRRNAFTTIMRCYGPIYNATGQIFPNVNKERDEKPFRRTKINVVNSFLSASQYYITSTTRFDRTYSSHRNCPTNWMYNKPKTTGLNARCIGDWDCQEKNSYCKIYNWRNGYPSGMCKCVDGFVENGRHDNISWKEKNFTLLLEHFGLKALKASGRHVHMNGMFYGKRGTRGAGGRQPRSKTRNADERRPKREDAMHCVKEDCYHHIGGNYRGTRAKARWWNHPCLAWNKLDNALKKNLDFGDEDIDDAKNYCRNPSALMDEPWCYVDVAATRRRRALLPRSYDTIKKIVRQRCHMPKCFAKIGDVESVTNNIIEDVADELTSRVSIEDLTIQAIDKSSNVTMIDLDKTDQEKQQWTSILKNNMDISLLLEKLVHVLSSWKQWNGTKKMKGNETEELPLRKQLRHRYHKPRKYTLVPANWTYQKIKAKEMEDKREWRADKIKNLKIMEKVVVKTRKLLQTNTEAISKIRHEVKTKTQMMEMIKKAIKKDNEVNDVYSQFLEDEVNQKWMIERRKKPTHERLKSPQMSETAKMEKVTSALDDIIMTTEKKYRLLYVRNRIKRIVLKKTNLKSTMKLLIMRINRGFNELLDSLDTAINANQLFRPRSLSRHGAYTILKREAEAANAIYNYISSVKDDKTQVFRHKMAANRMYIEELQRLISSYLTINLFQDMRYKMDKQSERLEYYTGRQRTIPRNVLKKVGGMLRQVRTQFSTAVKMVSTREEMVWPGQRCESTKCVLRRALNMHNSKFEQHHDFVSLTSRFIKRLQHVVYAAHKPTWQRTRNFDSRHRWETMYTWNVRKEKILTRLAANRWLPYPGFYMSDPMITCRGFDDNDDGMVSKNEAVTFTKRKNSQSPQNLETKSGSDYLDELVKRIRTRLTWIVQMMFPNGTIELQKCVSLFEDKDNGWLITSLFSGLDTNEDNKLDKKEITKPISMWLKEANNGIDHPLTSEDKKWADEFDNDNDGMISLQEAKSSYIDIRSKMEAIIQRLRGSRPEATEETINEMTMNNLKNILVDVVDSTAIIIAKGSIMRHNYYDMLETSMDKNTVQMVMKKMSMSQTDDQTGTLKTSMLLKEKAIKDTIAMKVMTMIIKDVIKTNTEDIRNKIYSMVVSKDDMMKLLKNTGDLDTETTMKVREMVIKVMETDKEINGTIAQKVQKMTKETINKKMDNMNDMEMKNMKENMMKNHPELMNKMKAIDTTEAPGGQEATEEEGMEEDEGMEEVEDEGMEEVANKGATEDTAAAQTELASEETMPLDQTLLSESQFR